MKFQLDRKLAYAIGLDADNRSMRKAGRTTWNEEDRDVAIDATNKAPHLIEAKEAKTT